MESASLFFAHRHTVCAEHRLHDIEMKRVHLERRVVVYHEQRRVTRDRGGLQLARDFFQLRPDAIRHESTDRFARTNGFHVLQILDIWIDLLDLADDANVAEAGLRSRVSAPLQSQSLRMERRDLSTSARRAFPKTVG